MSAEQPDRSVSWFAVERAGRKHLHELLGRKVVTRFIFEKIEHGYTWRKRASVPASEISSLSDPELRYALRLQSTVNSVGWAPIVGSSAMVRHTVAVQATDEGLDSRLISAVYSGNPGDIESFLIEHARRSSEAEPREMS